MFENMLKSDAFYTFLTIFQQQLSQESCSERFSRNEELGRNIFTCGGVEPPQVKILRREIRAQRRAGYRARTFCARGVPGAGFPRHSPIRITPPPAAQPSRGLQGAQLPFVPLPGRDKRQLALPRSAGCPAAKKKMLAQGLQCTPRPCPHPARTTLGGARGMRTSLAGGDERELQAFSEAPPGKTALVPARPRNPDMGRRFGQRLVPPSYRASGNPPSRFL